MILKFKNWKGKDDTMASSMAPRGAPPTGGFPWFWGHVRGAGAPVPRNPRSRRRGRLGGWVAADSGRGGKVWGPTLGPPGGMARRGQPWKARRPSNKRRPEQGTEKATKGREDALRRWEIGLQRGGPGKKNLVLEFSQNLIEKNPKRFYSWERGERG